MNLDEKKITHLAVKLIIVFGALNLGEGETITTNKRFADGLRHSAVVVFEPLIFGETRFSFYLDGQLVNRSEYFSEESEPQSVVVNEISIGCESFGRSGGSGCVSETTVPGIVSQVLFYPEAYNHSRIQSELYRPFGKLSTPCVCVGC